MRARIAVLALAAAAACGGGSPGTEVLDELARLTARANGLTYHVTYLAQGPTVGSAQVEKYRKPPRGREDFVAAAQRSAVFSLPSGQFQCSRPKGRPWSCHAGSKSAPSESTDRAAVRSDLEKTYHGSLTTSKRRVAGLDAECFSGRRRLSGDRPGSELETCFSPDGIPIYVRTAALTLVAQSFDRSVPESVFRLPAQPAS